MKKFIVLFVAVMAMFATTAKAQSSLLATLNHEGTISTFYGTNALIQAHAAAADGDVITLSSGTFQSVNITKAVTLRGAGMVLDAATQTEPTVLANEFSINIPDETTQRLTIEGVYTNQKVNIEKLKNAMFLKDRFNVIYAGYRSGQMATDLTFIHCKIADRYIAANTTYNSASFQNCIVSGIDGYNYIFNNCIIGLKGEHYLCYTSEYNNCVIKSPHSNSNSTTMYNNLYSGSRSLDIPNKTNVRVDEDSEVIKNILVYSDDNDFKLTEEAKALIKGTDGTEVGVYGGSLPYDPTPTNPQISKFNVAAKTTADGKLSVDIEVKSAE